jgi:transposase
VHSKKSVFTIQNASGEMIAEGEIETTPAGLKELRDRHELAAETAVALETGTVAFFVARQLRRLGLAPVVVDAYEVRLKAHRPRQKSDRRDARELCEGLRRGIYRTVVHVPPPAVALMRETLSRRRHFVRVATAEVNAAKRLLRATGLGGIVRSLATEAGWEKLFAKLDPEPELHCHLEQHRELWRCARQQVAVLEASLQEQSKASFAESIKRLQTIPAVGPVVAATAVAVFSDVERFATSRHAASYAGLVPSTYQSGERDVHGRITKRGSGELRAMLCQAAHHACRPTHPLHPYFLRLCAKRGYRVAVIAVAHRLCRIMYAMLRRATDFDVAKLGIEEGPFRQTTVRHYRIKKPSVLRA